MFSSSEQSRAEREQFGFKGSKGTHMYTFLPVSSRLQTDDPLFSSLFFSSNAYRLQGEAADYELWACQSYIVEGAWKCPFFVFFLCPVSRIFINWLTFYEVIYMIVWLNVFFFVVIVFIILSCIICAWTVCNVSHPVVNLNHPVNIMNHIRQTCLG